MIESKKQVLCIHCYCPPIRSGGVIRNYYFSRTFDHFFEYVYVVTTSNVEVLEQEEMEIPMVNKQSLGDGSAGIRIVKKIIKYLKKK